MCVCGSPCVCRAVQSGVLSSRARLHTNAMWQGRNTSTDRALAHPPSHTPTPPATATITPSPTLPHHAHTLLAVYFRHSTSSARRQNHKPSMFSLPLHFTSPKKSFPLFPCLPAALHGVLVCITEWHGFKWDILCNVPLCNATFSYVHPPSLARRVLSLYFAFSLLLSISSCWLVGFLNDEPRWQPQKGTSHLTFAAVTVWTLTSFPSQLASSSW